MLNDNEKELENKLEETDYSENPKALEEITFLAFREAYHTGQTGLLRRITGKEGAV